LQKNDPDPEIWMVSIALNFRFECWYFQVYIIVFFRKGIVK